ncbi:MAG: ribosome silencing factor [Actinomycetota bacterium]
MTTQNPTPLDSRELAIAAARAAAGKQATDITILDVRDLIAITDYFVLCSGNSERQVRTIVEGVEADSRALGERPVRREGESENRWVLLDYVAVVVHAFGEEERSFYDLERLWSDAPRVPFGEAEDADAAGAASSSR